MFSNSPGMFKSTSPHTHWLTLYIFLNVLANIPWPNNKGERQFTACPAFGHYHSIVICSIYTQKLCNRVYTHTYPENHVLSNFIILCWGTLIATLSHRLDMPGIQRIRKAYKICRQSIYYQMQ